MLQIHVYTGPQEGRIAGQHNGKMAKRVYSSTVKKWLVSSGAVTGTLIMGIFLYLSSTGAIIITGYSGDQTCAGNISDPCYAYVNLTANENIFIYPTDYDPWGRETIFKFAPGVESWTLQRSWGTGWRDIPLNETCTGTWCGAPNNKGVKYSYVLRKDRDYEFRVIAYKNEPSDVVKWAVNYEDEEYLDPTWEGVGISQNKWAINTDNSGVAYDYDNPSKDFIVSVRESTTNAGFSLKKWGESEFKVTLPNVASEITPGSQGQGQDIANLSYGYDEYTTSWYMVDDNTLEWELILKKKPTTNNFIFDYDLSNLECYYQPGLDVLHESPNPTGCNETDCWDKGGNSIEHRPANLVNSYACYHSSMSGNEYKTGKAFNIESSFVIDPNGEKAWCNQTIANGTWEITCPQGYLERGSIIGPTFGVTSIGGSSTQMRYTIGHIGKNSMHVGSSSDTVENLSLYATTSGSSLLSMAIYNLSSNLSHLKNRVSDKYRFTLDGTPQWHTNESINLTLSANQSYVVAVGEITDGDSDVYYDNADYGNGRWRSVGFTLDDPWPAATKAEIIYSMYADYITNSTPILLNNTEDDFFDADITSQDGSQVNLYCDFMDGTGEMPFFKFDISEIPTNAIIENAVFGFHTGDEDAETYDVWFVENQTWEEGQINDRCAGADWCGNMTDFLTTNLFTIAQDKTNEYKFIQLGNAIQNARNNAEDNFTVGFNNTASASEYFYVFSKENVDTAQRPLLTIRYINGTASEEVPEQPTIPEMCTNGWCIFNDSYNLEDVYIKENIATKDEHDEPRSKWDLSDYIPMFDYYGIGTTELQMYMTKEGSPDLDVAYLITDQGWTEATAFGSLTMDRENTSDPTMSSDSTGKFTNITITIQANASCMRNDSNFTIGLQDSNYIVDPIEAVVDSLTVLNLGHVKFLDNNKYAFIPREDSNSIYRPKLFISYPAMKLNESISDEDETRFYDEGFDIFWDSSVKLKATGGCGINVNGTHYISDPYEDARCNYSSSTNLSLGNYSIDVYGYTPSDRIVNETNSYWVNLTQRDVSGYWLFRAPINSSDADTGNSYSRRNSVDTGNGQDLGAMWRNSTEDDEGNLIGDEERHCDIWSEFFLDEQGYRSGTIDEVYCHVWIYYTGTRDDTGFGWSDSGYQESDGFSQTYYDAHKGINVFATDSNSSFPDINATYFKLLTYYNDSLGWDYADEFQFYNGSFKVTSDNMQIMSFPNQRSWCIFNDINGSDLGDLDALDLTDFDGDGITDYEELFVTRTDPYESDTDDDTHDDGTEKDNNKDGWDPYDWGTKHIYNPSTHGGIDMWMYKKNDSYQIATPVAKDYNDTLDWEFTSTEYNNMASYFSGSAYARTLQNTTDNYQHSQINVVVNVTQNISNIITTNVFWGGILQPKTAEDYGEYYDNRSSQIVNHSGTNLYVPGKKGRTKSLYLKQTREGFEDIIDSVTDTSGLLSYGVHLISSSNAIAGDVQSFLNVDFAEVWIITGGSILDITGPTTSDPITFTYPKNITVNLTFTEEGTTIISGFNIENITAGGEICTLHGATVYNVDHWEQNCSLPDLDSGTFDLVATGNTSTSGYILGTEQNSIISQGSCVCPGAGNNWEVNMEDECQFTDPCTLTIGNLSWIGSSGFFNCSAQLNLSNRNAPPSATTFYFSDECEIIYLILLLFTSTTIFKRKGGL